MYIFIYIYIYVCIWNIYTYIYIYICMYLYMYTYIYIYVCVFMTYVIISQFSVLFTLQYQPLYLYLCCIVGARILTEHLLIYNLNILWSFNLQVLNIVKVVLCSKGISNKNIPQNLHLNLLIKEIIDLLYLSFDNFILSCPCYIFCVLIVYGYFLCMWCFADYSSCNESLNPGTLLKYK